MHRDPIVVDTVSTEQKPPSPYNRTQDQLQLVSRNGESLGKAQVISLGQATPWQLRTGCTPESTRNKLQSENQVKSLRLLFQGKFDTHGSIHRTS